MAGQKTNMPNTINAVNYSKSFKKLFKEPYTIKPRIKPNTTSNIDSLPRLFDEPSVEKTASFKNITSIYTISNIEENNISKYFDTIYNSIYETIKDFKQKDNIKFQIKLINDFTTPLPFDKVESYFNTTSKVIITLDDFKDKWENVEEEFKEWIDEFQEKGSGFVFQKITKCILTLTKINNLLASSYFEHPLLKGKKTIINVQKYKRSKMFHMEYISKVISTKNNRSYNKSI